MNSFTFVKKKVFKMDIDKRIQAFTELGLFLKNIANNSNKSELGYNFIKKMEEASISNQWFTASNINFALNEISKSLEKENLEKWISKYPKVKLNVNPKIVGIVAAGNIPLVGFHDIAVSYTHLTLPTKRIV